MPKLLRIILLTLSFIAVSGGAFTFFWYKDTKMPKKQVEEKITSLAIVENSAEEDDIASQLELATSTDAALATTTESGQEILDKGEPVSSGPDIPVEQYWAFGTMNGLKIYVNNTDRNVIYALNDKGKIVWQIWGKDNGFEKFEIRLKENYLFVSGSVKGAKYPTSGLWVIGADGKLAWKYEFYGYLDMPQMLITNDKHVLLENRYGSPSPGGNMFRMFDLVTGKILWTRGPDNFYGMYNFLLDNGNILTKSGGVGSGRFKHQYELDSKTGAVLSYKITVDDNELASLNHPNIIQTYKQLIIDVLNKKIFLAKYSDANQIFWTKGEDAELYKLINENLSDGLRVAVLGSVIHIEEQQATSSVSHVFSLADGSHIWKKDLSSDKLAGITTVWELNNSLQVRMSHRTECTELCDTCPSNQLICADVEPSAECTACRTKEKNAADYVQEGIRSFHLKTGEWQWDYLSKNNNLWVSEISEAKSAITVQSGETNKFILDAKTGKIK